jgi:hypothetical protein
LAGNPKTIVVNDIETSLTLSMRLVLGEELLDRAEQAHQDARLLWERTRAEADRRTAFDAWCKRNNVVGEIKRLAAAGLQVLKAEQKMAKGKASKLRTWWLDQMAEEIQDQRYRNSPLPRLLQVR